MEKLQRKRKKEAAARGETSHRKTNRPRKLVRSMSTASGGGRGGGGLRGGGNRSRSGTGEEVQGRSESKAVPSSRRLLHLSPLGLRGGRRAAPSLQNAPLQKGFRCGRIICRRPLCFNVEYRTNCQHRYFYAATFTATVDFLTLLPTYVFLLSGLNSGVDLFADGGLTRPLFGFTETNATDILCPSENLTTIALGPINPEARPSLVLHNSTYTITVVMILRVIRAFRIVRLVRHIRGMRFFIDALKEKVTSWAVSLVKPDVFQLLGLLVPASRHLDSLCRLSNGCSTYVWCYGFSGRQRNVGVCQFS